MEGMDGWMDSSDCIEVKELSWQHYGSMDIWIATSDIGY